MRYTTLPATDFAPSVICLGTGSFGTRIPQDQAFAMLDLFAELGGNFLDTARVYAAWLPGGTGASERTIGAWLKRRGMAGRVIVATKGGHPDLATMHISRLSPQEIAADVAASLDALGVATIDLYWLHRDDPAIPVGEIMDALHEQVAAGRLTALGASNWTTERIAAANAHAADHGLTGFCGSQIGWSLAQADISAAPFGGTLTMAPPTLAYHRCADFPVMAYSSQAAGFFAGKADRYRDRPDAKADGFSRTYVSAANFARLDRARELAARHDRPANDIALAYLLSQPFPVYALVGCRTVEQVRSSCAASDLRLSAEEIAYLETDV
jgi:aryl-alcohol dehydrogenase-like predicted oxidoreductase